MVLTGRFDERAARARRGAAHPPRLLPWYINQMQIARLTGHPERMGALVATIEKENCGPDFAVAAKCVNELWQRYVARDWPRLAAIFQEPCIREHGIGIVLPHLAAVLEGDLALARQMEAFEAKQRSRYKTRDNPLVPHTAAIREVAEGDLAEALETSPPRTRSSSTAGSKTASSRCTTAYSGARARAERRPRRRRAAGARGGGGQQGDGGALRGAAGAAAAGEERRRGADGYAGGNAKAT